MNKVLDTLSDLSSDQKKNLVFAMIVGIVLCMYALSKYSDGDEQVVVQSKASDFKGGNIVSDRASDYYQNKDRLLSKQYDSVKSSQDLLGKQLKELQIALTKLEKERDKDKAESEPEQENSSQDQMLEKLEAFYGKKMNQRVRKQLKINFPLEKVA